MFAPVFDGQYRSRPRVSLRGSSRQEERGATLLQRVHQEREGRDLVRRKLHAAITIQAHYRGHLTRLKLYSKLRGEFDELCGVCDSTGAVESLSRLLLIFYQQDTDHERLVLLLQRWLKFQAPLASQACLSSTSAYHLYRVLVLTCHTLYSTPTQTLSRPLRMLEVFTEPSTYPMGDRGKEFSRSLLQRLLADGYFRSLRRVLEARVPPPDEPVLFPPPLPASILEYMARPVVTGIDSHRLFTSMAVELFGPPLTAHTCHLILPYLSTLSLPLPSLLHTLTSSLNSGEVPTSPELLYAIIHLFHSNLATLPQSSFTGYLRLTAQLLSRTPRENLRASGDWDRLDGEEEEEKEEEPDPLGSTQELLACCCNTLSGDQILEKVKHTSPLNSELLEWLCSLCYHLISHDKGSTLHSRTKLFQRLALTPSLLSPLWKNIREMTVPRTFGAPVPCLQQLSRGVALPTNLAAALIERLSVFSTLFSIYLSTLHDSEFYGETAGLHMPFPISELVGMVSVLRDVFISTHMEKHTSSAFLTRQSKGASDRPARWEWTCLNKCLLQVLLGLYERDCRRPFCPTHHWEVLAMPPIPIQLFLESEGEEMEPPPLVPMAISKQAKLLKLAPFVFPFVDRVKFFQQLVLYDRRSVQGQLQDFLIGPGLHITARRNYIYEDAFSKLARGEDVRKKLRVNLVNAQGLSEPGIDGGGVFREFLNELLKTGFDPNHGYFSATQDGLLYPNPQVHLINDEFAIHYQFLGKMLGKALYENLLVELPFAGFFLCKLTDKGRGTVGTHYLASLDPELYRHLLSLKQSEGDIEDLCLNFTVVNSEFGQTKVVELKRGGTNISVTRANCIEYIHRVAHYRLNRQIERQFQAFRQGLSAVIPVQWLGLFNQRELQVLISGAEVPIDVSDLRRHTTYSGEFTPEHEYVQMFWDVVSEFGQEQRQQLLKFVTSCSRPPLLGFKDLHPPFCVLPGGREDRLPSASTCMNVLKLPIFKDRATLAARLTYAIASGAGFELS